MANEIDLGELQDKLESDERKHKLAKDALIKARGAWERAVDREIAWNASVQIRKQQLDMALFTLTRKV